MKIDIIMHNVTNTKFTNHESKKYFNYSDFFKGGPMYSRLEE